MSKTAHLFYILILTLIVIAVSSILCYKGISFYKVSIEEEFFHPDYALLKPSGSMGHGLGILGSFFMLLGVLTYMFRKRFRSFSRLGSLKYWLEFHRSGTGVISYLI